MQALPRWKVLPTRGNLLFALWVYTCTLFMAVLASRALNVYFANRADLLQVVDYFFDDAYYYLCLAANLAETGRSSLDGITLTNGYHPLWLAILAGLASAVSADSWILFQAAHLLVCLIAGLGVAGWYWRYRRNEKQVEIVSTVAIGLAITVVLNRSVFLEGMEPILLVPLLVPLVIWLESPPDRRSHFVLSAMLALAFLARIDSLALAASSFLVVIGSLVWVERARLRSAESAASIGLAAIKICAVLVPVVLLYFAANEYFFGSAVPVSGKAKSLGGPLFANWGGVEFFERNFWPTRMPYFVLAVLEAVFWISGFRSKLLLRSLAVLIIATCIQGVYYASFSTWPIWPWYRYLSCMSLAVAIARVLHIALTMLTGRPIRYAGVAIIGMVMLFATRTMAMEARTPVWQLISGLPKTVEVYSFNQVSLEMLDLFGPPGAKVLVAMGDRAGGLAYWGRDRLSLIQTEGLTLDIAYLAARRTVSPDAYFSRFDIRYWIVDREALPMVRSSTEGVEDEYVVADPVQSRIAFQPVPIFCFPKSSVIYQREYSRDAHHSFRFVFDYSKHQPCSAEAQALIQSLLSGTGLRQFSLPGEYTGNFAYRKENEDRDRARARRLLGIAASPEPP